MYEINYWPILVASVVAFGIGTLWYSPILFGKEWMALTKTVSDSNALESKNAWKAYIIHLIALLVSFSVLGFLVSASTAVTATDGAFLGFIIWLGFVATEHGASLMWERRPLKLVLINSICTLLTLVIGGAIIGAW